MAEFLNDLIESNDISFQQILNNLLDGNENLDLKTHIFKPKQLAGLKTLVQYLKIFGYKKSSELIKEFIINYLRYMVSYKRLGRTEIIKALTRVIDDTNSSNTSKGMMNNLS